LAVFTNDMPRRGCDSQMLPDFSFDSRRSSATGIADSAASRGDPAAERVENLRPGSPCLARRVVLEQGRAASASAGAPGVHADADGSWRTESSRSRRDRLDVHVTDVVNVLKHEDPRDVVLVGHSSSGAVITGVADRTPAQIALVVYLDAFVPEDGQAVLDLITPERRQMMEGLVRTEGNGWLLPRFAPPPWETIVRDMWGVTDQDDVRWMLERRGPTPLDI
jgi:pimeloyl-ACP methyl ester carboxylesterase